jgi:glycosyltransferase involved in cell wall biosynthesis
MKILYISYDGVLEPLGQSQILSYLKNLSLSNKIFLLSFEKKKDLANTSLYKNIYKIVNKSNIKWYKFRYHKHPLFLSTLFDIFLGYLVALKIVLSERIDLIHARSFVPTFIAMLIKSITSIKIIFDMRGFWVDERVDSGIWKKNSIIFRLSKYLETFMLKNSDHIISLTDNAKKFIFHKTTCPISVIPTCVNTNRFYSKNKKNKNLIFGYVGTASNWYNFDQVLEYFKEALLIEKNSKLMIINRNEHSYILSRINFFKIPLKKIILKSSNYSNIPKLINQMSVGIFFIKPTFSKKASCPTKFAEFLSCGVPIITACSVGDVDKIVQKEKIGVIVKSFSKKKIKKNIKKIIKLINKKNISKRCRVTAEKYFSLIEGSKRYNHIYTSLSSNSK